MRSHLIASCTLCSKPVDDATACWRSGVWSNSRVHALCLAAFFLIADSPSRPDREVVDEANERAGELCELLCENPSHTSPKMGEN